MPCYEASYKYSKGDAILCAVLHKAEKEGSLDKLISDLNYNLCGLDKGAITKWWQEHKKLDAAKLKSKE